MIIGLNGPAGSGKSVIAEHLERRHGFVGVRFSAPLKNMLRAIGLNNEELEGSLKQTPHERLLGKTPREAMQTLGTEWGRNLIHPDLWINLWRLEVREHKNVVTEDCRFPNEAEIIREAQGAIWKVFRLDNTLDVGQHESEAYYITPDVNFRNDGTIRDLCFLVDQT